MQKRSPVARLYHPQRLPEAFAYRHTSHRQRDEEIVYLHSHDCLELGFCHGGAGIFVVEDKVMPYRAGDVSVINDREMHLARSMAGTTSDWSFIYLQPAKLLPQASGIMNTASLAGPGFMNIISADDEPALTALVGQLADLGQPSGAHWRELVSGLVQAILARCHRLPGRSSDAGEDRSRRDRLSQVAPALQHMGAHLDEEIRLAELAGLCGLSEPHFRRCFRAALGQGPKRYLTRLRLRMAVAQLSDPARAILGIAMSCGFGSLSSFNRHFRAAFGCSPRAWRQGGMELGGPVAP